MADVQILINEARLYASTVLEHGMAALGTAMAVANALGGTRDGDTFPPINLTPPTLAELGDIPIFAGEGFNDPQFYGTHPQLLSAPQLDVSGSPGIMPTIATVSDPLKPAGEPVLTAVAPTLDSSVLHVPAPPDLLAEIRGITPPVITPITVAPAPAYIAPVFLGVSPTAPPSPPTNLDDVMHDNYATISPIMRHEIEAELDTFIDREFPSFRTGLAKIETRLATYLDGGTALTTVVQDQILTRAMAKTDVEYRRGRATVYDEAARAGHSLPSPVVLGRVQELEQDRRNNNSNAVRDLMVKIAEMEQQNMQFAVTQSSSLRGVMLNAGMAFYSGLIQINGQALEYARSIVDAIVKVYDAAVRFSEVQARIYEAEGNVYSAKVRGALGALEAYTAYVRGLEAQANLKTAEVQAYTARINAVKAEADVYTAQVNAVVAAAQIEKLKVEIYQAQVGAYAAQVNAYTARWQGYEAQVRGNTAIVQASAERVRAYGQQVDAYRAIIQARTAQIDTILKTNEGNVRVYQVEVEAYRTHVAALAEVNKATIDSHDLSLKSYVARSNAEAEFAKSNLAYFNAALQAVIADIQVILQVQRENNNLDVSRVNAIAQIATASAHNYSTVAQSALSGMNTLIAQTAQE